LSTIYSFIPVSGCVDRATVNCFALGHIMLLGRAYERGLSRYVGPGHGLARRAKKGQLSK
jgi:hypothetical protein